MTKNKGHLIAAIGLFVFSLLLFLFHIQFPRNLNYDEFHYVPAAKKFIAQTQNSNWEHPPLAKYFIAAGIKLGGDRAVGWRLFSALFSCFTVLGIFFLALELFRDRTIAVAAGFIALFNHFLFVHARIAMLDTFMMTFLIWALYFFYRAWDPQASSPQVKRNLLWAGILFALGSACKWPAAFAWIMAIGLALTLKLAQALKLRDQSMPKERAWYSLSLWKEIRISYLLISLLGIPILVYYLTHLPLVLYKYHQYSLSDILAMPKIMYQGQLRVVKFHNYMSEWWQWLLVHRPMWYAFDREGTSQEFVRGVALIGNPMIMWLGLLAMGYTFWDWVRSKERAPFLISIFWILYTFIWALVPRKVSFYYYYFPSAMLMTFGIAYCFWRLRQNMIFQYVFATSIFLWPLLTLLFYPEGNLPFAFIQQYYPFLAVLGLVLGMLLLKLKSSYFQKNWTVLTFVALVFVVFVHFYPIMAALKIDRELFRNWMWTRSWI